MRRPDGFTQFLEPVLDGCIKQHIPATRIRVIAKFGRALPELLPAPSVWIIPNRAPSGLRIQPSTFLKVRYRIWCQTGEVQRLTRFGLRRRQRALQVSRGNRPLA